MRRADEGLRHGATGVIGRPLVDRLLAGGHAVDAMTRSSERAEALRARGVAAVVCDAFDVDGVRRAAVFGRGRRRSLTLGDEDANVDRPG
jgi:nucleoside-diphosphate-sugar epimerase